MGHDMGFSTISSMKTNLHLKSESAYDVLPWQKCQYTHDKRNHFDILSLSKGDRLKHYGLHFAKYAGRLARGSSEPKPINATGIDSLLVTLSAANTLHQQLCIEIGEKSYGDVLLQYVSLAGQFCDACEKIDHMEEFLTIARDSNVGLFNLSLTLLKQQNCDVEYLLTARRKQLADRQFYIESKNVFLG